MPNLLFTPFDEFVLEALPEHVQATMEVRDNWLKQLPPADNGLEFVVSDLQRWQPGSTVRVAFLGGTTALHRDIAAATQQITDACNLKLDFGFTEGGGARLWQTSDAEFAAEIRVSFDQSGFFSLVGTDSVNEGVGAAGEAVGGRPGQRSLNLGGFPIQRPSNWQGVVRHEFLHALAFQHEHQSPGGPCDAEFRWEDDAGYQLTSNANGTHVIDAAGRRPGIYTYLGGPPNNWTRAKVDHNLRKLTNANLQVGAFDRSSVMLYRFPELFYKHVPSLCGPLTDGLSLSEGDKQGLQLLYPAFGPPVENVVSRQGELLHAVENPAEELEGLESLTPLSTMARHISTTLRAVRAR